MESLLDKLKSLGVSIGKNSDREDISSSSRGIEEFVSGKEFESHLGITFVSEKAYNLTYPHGKYLLHDQVNLSTIGQIAKIKSFLDSDYKNLLFLDTETTGLAGGTGTLVFLTGLGYFSGGSFHIRQYFLKNPSQESAYLAWISHQVASGKTIISYNGKAFDVPLLNTRYIINHMDSPFITMPHFDLLHLTRRLWRNVYGSRALSYLETHVLGSQRDQEEVPGWLIPSIYQEYLKSGDAEEVARVFYHNTFDILSLASLFNFCADLLHNPKENCRHSLEIFSVIRLNQEVGNDKVAINLFDEALANMVPDQDTRNGFNEFAGFCKAKNDWTRAIRIWTQLAQAGDIDAMIELAKYHEHKEKNYLQAFYWARQAIKESVESDPSQIVNIQYRIDRLTRRMNG
jgi:hypothetical protein